MVRQFANDIDKLKKIFQDIVAIECPDGIEFNETVEVNEIQKDGDYVGKRVTFQGKLGVIPKTLQIGIGFGDKIIPRPLLMDYPTLLEGVPGSLFNVG